MVTRGSASCARWAAALLCVACGPSAELVVVDGGGGGAGVVDEPWQPPTEATPEPGPNALAMATDGPVDQLVAFGARGVVTPWGPPLPPSDSDARLQQLVWLETVGRGAVLRRGDGGSDVFAIDGQRLHAVGVDLPAVQWIEVSREGWLVILHHQDASTSVVTHDDEVIVALEPPANEYADNFVAFGDGDGWAIWPRRVDPDAEFSASEYWIRDFSTATTSSLITVPFGTSRWFTFETSALLHQSGREADAIWLDLDGDVLAVDSMPTIKVGPDRHFFVGGRALHLEDRAVTDIGAQALPPGRVQAYVPGHYALVETDEGAVAFIPPTGSDTVALTPGSDARYKAFSAYNDPERPSVVVSLEYADAYTDDQLYWLWRPFSDEKVRLGNDYLTSRRFTEDGTLIRLQRNGAVSAVMPDGDALVELDTTPWAIEGFGYANEVIATAPRRPLD